jgi:hypothetical protein
MAKLPSMAAQNPSSADREEWGEALVSSLNQLGSLSEYLLGICDTETLKPEKHHEELQKLKPYLRTCLVESMTLGASLSFPSTRSKGCSESIAAAAVAGLCRAERGITNESLCQRVVLAYSQIGRALVDDGLPANAILPCLRAVVVLERHSIAKAPTQVSSSDAKLSSRLLTLSDVVMQCGNRVAALKVLRHAVLRSPQNASLVDRFVRLQVLDRECGDSADSKTGLEEISGKVEQELMCQPFMADLPGDEEATESFFTLTPAARLASPPLVSALDEMRALNSLLSQRLAQSSTSDSKVVERSIQYHELLVSQMQAKHADEAPPRKHSLGHCAALVLSGTFYRLAACSCFPSEPLGRFVRSCQAEAAAAAEEEGRHEEVDQQPPKTTDGDVPRGTGALSARLWLNKAAARLSQSIEALETPECFTEEGHLPGSAPFELGFAYLARGVLNNMVTEESADSSDDHNAFFLSALSAFTSAEQASHGSKDLDGACSCSVCGNFAARRGQRLSDALRLLGDQFALTARTWEQVVVVI